MGKYDFMAPFAEMEFQYQFKKTPEIHHVTLTTFCCLAVTQFYCVFLNTNECNHKHYHVMYHYGAGF